VETLAPRSGRVASGCAQPRTGLVWDPAARSREAATILTQGAVVVAFPGSFEQLPNQDDQISIERRGYASTMWAYLCQVFACQSADFSWESRRNISGCSKSADYTSCVAQPHSIAEESDGQQPVDGTCHRSPREVNAIGVGDVLCGGEGW
jgi:hypothetical protein